VKVFASFRTCTQLRPLAPNLPKLYDLSLAGEGIVEWSHFSITYHSFGSLAGLCFLERKPPMLTNAIKAKAVKFFVIFMFFIVG